MSIDYDLVRRQFDALAETESDPLATSSNFVALLYSSIPDINWLGIYVRRDADLVLGPFQGLPACSRIPIGQGVCGMAAMKKETLRVDDVHAFDGHITCDPASRSELVVPLIHDDEVFAVLDIDSPAKARFAEADQAGVESLCRSFVAALAAGRTDLSGVI